MSQKPLHPDLARSLWPSLVAPLRAALGAGDGSWRTLVEEPHPGVFRLALLEPAACARLCDELARHEAREEGAPPNSMHRYGVRWDELGYGRAMDELLTRLVRPLAAGLLGEVLAEGGASLVSRHAFAVRYAADGDRALGFHVDDSDVTLNLCLGEDFTGSELYFRGRRCPRHREVEGRFAERFQLEHRVGEAVLHAGAHRHGVLPVVRGVRRNLLLWCQTTRDRQDERAPCPIWCGAHPDRLRAQR